MFHTILLVCPVGPSLWMYTLGSGIDLLRGYTRSSIVVPQLGLQSGLEGSRMTEETMRTASGCTKIVTGMTGTVGHLYLLPVKNSYVSLDC